MAKINDSVPGPEPIKLGKDFKLTRFIRNRKVVWYGPHECNNCGGAIVKSSFNQGGVELDAPHDHHYPNHRWVLHRCNKPENSPKSDPRPSGQKPVKNKKGVNIL